MARIKKKDIKVGIVIPVRNCLALTQAAIASIKTKYPYQVIVVDHFSDQSMKDWLISQRNIISLIDPTGTTGLAFNWNRGIQIAVDTYCTHILVANNDILLHPKTIDNLVDRLLKDDVVMATGVNNQGMCPNPVDIFTLTVGEFTETEHPDFSCFMITEQTIKKIGWFDENFNGAYVEDCDYHARIALAGEKAITFNGAPYYHYASMTIRENMHIASQIQQHHAINEDYFRRKWGRAHVGDVPDMLQYYYKTPFNDPNKTIKDW